MSSKRKEVNNQQYTEQILGTPITFYNRGVEIQFDTGKLSKKTVKKLKSAELSLQIGSLKCLVPKKSDKQSDTYLGYPLHSGNIGVISLREIYSSVILPQQIYNTSGYKGLSVDAMKYKYLVTMVMKLVDKIQVKEAIDALNWAKQAKSLGVKVPYGWAMTDKRWVKTVKILVVSTYLQNYFASYDTIPTVQAVRCLVNNIESSNQTIIVTSDEDEFAWLAKNEVIVSPDGNTIVGAHHLKDVTVLLQSGGMGVIPGTTFISQEDGTVYAETPAIMNCDMCVCKITYSTVDYTNKNTTPNNSALVLYLPWCKNLDSNYSQVNEQINVETLKMIAQKVAIALQYPLEYISWKK